MSRPDPGTRDAIGRGDRDRDGRQRAARRDRRRPAPRVEAAGSPPICLATVLVGDDAPSQRYVRAKHAKAAEAGIRSPPRRPAADGDAGRRSRRPSPSSPPTPTCTASSSSSRCPTGLDPEGGARLIPAEKDVDGLTERSLGRLVRGAAGPRRLHAARRDPPARALRRRDVRRRAVIVGRSHARRPPARRCCSPARASTPRSRSPTPAPTTSPRCAARPTSSSPPPARRG